LSHYPWLYATQDYYDASMKAPPLSRLQFSLALLALAWLVIACMPVRAIIPVQGATPRDWNPLSFWFEPWGRSGVHKGIDIFAPQGRPVLSAVPGVLLYQGRLGMGGEVVAVLGPGWRVHYYAHLTEKPMHIPFFVARGTRLGEVGTTGNAIGKPAHLHYAIVSLIPLPWRATGQTQGWKLMFFLNPIDLVGQP
jgi:peptidoglycan LD-endopeptidase LytH